MSRISNRLTANKRTKQVFTTLLVVLFLFSSIAFLIQIPTAKATTGTFGFTGVGGTQGDAAEGFAYLFKFTMTDNGYVTKISVYENGKFGVDFIQSRASIYSDNAGAPDALLAQSSDITVSGTAGWNDYTISTSLTVGTYWLGIVDKSAGSDIIYYFDAGSTNQRAEDQLTGDAYNNPCTPEGWGYADEKASIYATYTVTGTPTPPTTPSGFGYVMDKNGASYEAWNLSTNTLITSGASSSTVFNSFSACPTNSKIYVMSGAYSIDATWIITENNLNITTDGAVLTLSGNNWIGPAFYFNYVNNSVISGFTIDGNASGNTKSLYGAFATSDNDGIDGVGYFNLVTNCTIYNVRSFGIWFAWDSYNCGVTYCTIHNCGANGIQINGISDYAKSNEVYRVSDVCISTYRMNVTIADNYVHDPEIVLGGGHSNSLWGIGAEQDFTATGGHNITISGNTIVNCNWGVSDSGLETVTIENNRIFTTKYMNSIGMWVSGIGGGIIKNNTIVNMTYIDGGGNNGLGIVLDSAFNETVISNTIYNCSQGLQVYNANYSTIRSNNVINSGGLLVFSTSTTDNIIGNTFSVNGSGIQTNGVTIYNSPTNLFFANNTAWGSVANWTLGSSTNTTLQGNTGLVNYKSLNVTSINATTSFTSTQFNLTSVNGTLWQTPTNTVISLNSTPDSGYSFSNYTFTNGTKSTSNPMSFVLSDDRDVSLVLTNSSVSPNPTQTPTSPTQPAIITAIYASSLTGIGMFVVVPIISVSVLIISVVMMMRSGEEIDSKVIVAGIVLVIAVNIVAVVGILILNGVISAFPAAQFLLWFSNTI